MCMRHIVLSGLRPYDFHLIPKMKEPLRGIRFRTVPEILQATRFKKKVIEDKMCILVFSTTFI